MACHQLTIHRLVALWVSTPDGLAESAESADVAMQWLKRMLEEHVPDEAWLR